MQKFNVGDDVLSQWSDGKFYPGTVMSVKDSGSYVVMFYDGLKKLVRPNLLKPITSEKEKVKVIKVDVYKLFLHVRYLYIDLSQRLGYKYLIFDAVISIFVPRE